MRVSHFWRLMDEEFGRSYARSLAKDLALTSLGGLTASEALDAGLDIKAIWDAVCQAQEVPEPRRLGKDIKPKD